MGFPILPHVQVTGFLPRSDLAALLEWTLSQEAAFAAATVHSGDDTVVKPAIRVGMTNRRLGPMKSVLEARLLEALPALMQRIGATGAEPRILELELAAHGDGAHYKPHTDIPIGKTRELRTATADRVLSAVLYFHAEPKRFEGGQLRLFGMGSEAAPDPAAPGLFVDVEPLQNSLVAFHSWVRHEVRPIRCPSGNFRDYRFAVNCWFRRPI